MKTVDLSDDEKFPLVQARKFEPFTSKTSLSTLYRASAKGSRGIDGQLHRLRVERWPGGFVTCRRWLREFIEDLNRPAGTPEKVAARYDAAIQAERYLDAVGI